MKSLKTQAISVAQNGLININSNLFKVIRVLSEVGFKLGKLKDKELPTVATPTEEQAAEALAKFLTDVPDAVSSCPDNQPSADTYVPLEQPIVDRFAKERNTDPGLNNQRIKRVERATF